MASSIATEDELKEAVPLRDGIVFNQEAIEPIFCKPKLLPMKTISTEKLEKMQRDAERVVFGSQQPQDLEALTEDTNEAPTEEDGEKTTEVWTADG